MEFAKKFDILGQGYSLNLNGEEKHRTLLGAVFSVLAIGLIAI